MRESKFILNTGTRSRTAPKWSFATGHIGDSDGHASQAMPNNLKWYSQLSYSHFLRYIALRYKIKPPLHASGKCKISQVTSDLPKHCKPHSQSTLWVSHRSPKDNCRWNLLEIGDEFTSNELSVITVDSPLCLICMFSHDYFILSCYATYLNYE